MRTVRLLAGTALGVAGVVAPAWGIFHLVRTPSCGSDGVQVYGGPCPDDFALWIVAVVVAATVVLPLAVAIAGGGPREGLVLLGPVLVMAPLCIVAGVVVSLAGPSSDPDTRWIGWLVGVLAAMIVTRALVAWMRRRMGRAASA